MDTTEPGIYLNSADGVLFSVLLAGRASPVQLSAVTPAEDLLAAVSVDYTDYRREVQLLRENHPLFKPKRNISAAALEDLAAEALLLPSMLAERDPVSMFALGWQLDRCLRMRDDGSASFLLRAGQSLVRTLETPVRVQLRLRNIFEMAFDDAETVDPRRSLKSSAACIPTSRGSAHHPPRASQAECL